MKRLMYNWANPIKKEFPFFIINCLFLFQNTIFAVREWSVISFITFFTSTILYSYIATSIIYCLKSKLLKWILYCIGLIFCFVNLFLYLQFATRISPNIIQLLIETNTQESSDFIRSYLSNGFFLIVLTIAFFSLLSIIIIERYKCELNKINKLFKFVFLFLLIGGFISISRFYCSLMSCKNTIEVDEWIGRFEARPMDNLSNFVYCIYDINLMKKEITDAIKVTELDNDSTLLLSDSINIILVIGESFNKHHSNLYGYYLNTNPTLTCEQKNGRLFVFTNAFSLYNLTSKVIRNMMSTNSIGESENWADRPFFPAIFKKAGYCVYFWDNQYNPLAREGFDFSLNSYLHNPIIEKLSYTETNSRIYGLDHELTDDYFQKIKQREGSSFFSIFHLMGQHFSYYHRFPHTKDFFYYAVDSIRRDAVFLTDEMCHVISDYDNATRYNDYVIGNIINYYSSKKSVLVYLSDHGEEVYDYRNHYGRSWEKPITLSMIKYQYEIPFVIWCSDEYKKQYPDKIEAIKASLNKPFTSDNICHLLFNLGCVKTKYYIPDRDIINNKYKCPPIKINDYLCPIENGNDIPVGSKYQ